MFLPPSTLGILGSGQLGRMLALVARERGYRVHVFGPGADSPAGQVADQVWDCGYDDEAAARDFATSVDVITYEFENIPLKTAAATAEIVPIRPGLEPLRIAQNRLFEKQFLRELGVPTAVFWPLITIDDVNSDDFSLPAVLKTARSGYDGKGQVVISRREEAPAAWAALEGVPAVLEQWVALEKEFSVIIGRDVHGGMATYGPIENTHAHHILDTSVCPAMINSAIGDRAVATAEAIAVALDLVGVICIEFFITAAGELLVNEMAPRPHNSGHLTIEGHVTSQFEQQLRTVCGWPVGRADLRQPTAMANLLGDLWGDDRPVWERVSPDGQVKLHLYGKETARPGRKMGHLTAWGTTAVEALNRVVTARAQAKQSLPQGETIP